MKVMIVTYNFVREVCEFARYASYSADDGIEFLFVMPECPPDSLSRHIVILKPFFTSRIRTILYSPKALSEAFRTFRPDIVQAFEEYSGWLAFECAVLRKLLCPSAKLMVYSAENLLQNVHALFKMSTWYVMNKADLAFVCSEGVRETLEAEGFSKPIAVFPLGVNTTIFRKCPNQALKSQLGLDGKFVIGYVGRLIEIKGIFMLLDALRALPDNVHLLMIGSGDHEERFRRMASDIGVAERIHLVGSVEVARLAQYLNCMDVGVLPSRTTPRWKEQFGRAIVELMSCEVPVIGSSSGAIPEIIGHAGYIFQEDHPGELLDCILRLFNLPNERERLGRLGREQVCQYYSTDVMSEAFFKIYDTLYEKP